MTDVSATDGSNALGFERLLAAYQGGERQTLLPSLEEAIRGDTGDPRIWHLHGVVLRELDRRDEALSSLRKAAATAPGSADIAHALARTLLETGLPSVDAFRSVLKLSPANEEVVTGLASAFVANGEPQNALKLLEDV